ncbi:hypothetical protein TNCV_2187431 [Trichonephila clavipes]|nr:hypothetical protein TNCV_2187431 [Trichonephila clavipes]
MTSHRPTVCWLRSVDSREKRTLFAMTEGLQQSITPATTAVAIQTVCHSTQFSVHCCVWAYEAGIRIAPMYSRYVIAKSVCNEPRNIGTGPTKNYVF